MGPGRHRGHRRRLGQRGDRARGTRLLARGESRRLKCLAHIDDPGLALLLEANEFRSTTGGVTLDYFTVDAHAARILVSRYVLSSRESVRVAVVGAGALVEQFLDSLDREQSAVDSVPSRLVIVGLEKDALDEADRLVARAPHVRGAEVLDCSTLSIAEWGTRVCEKGTVVLVDRADDGTTLQTALALRRPAATAGATVVACVRRSPGLEQALSAASEDDFDAVQAYSVITATCTAELLDRSVHEQLARSIHEQYVAQLRAKPDANVDERSLVGWDELEETYRDANRAQAADVFTKLKQINCDVTTIPPTDQPPFAFRPEEVAMLASWEHERWRKERTRDGWTYGPVKDTDAKQNPDLVDFGELSDDEQKKDRHAVLAIPLILGRAGIFVVRTVTAEASPSSGRDGQFMPGGTAQLVSITTCCARPGIRGDPRPVIASQPDLAANAGLLPTVTSWKLVW